MQIFNFVVLSVITALFSILILAKSICPLFHLVSVNSNWIDAERAVKKKTEFHLAVKTWIFEYQIWRPEEVSFYRESPDTTKSADNSY